MRKKSIGAALAITAAISALSVAHQGRTHAVAYPVYCIQLDHLLLNLPSETVCVPDLLG